MEDQLVRQVLEEIGKVSDKKSHDVLPELTWTFLSPEITAKPKIHATFSYFLSILCLSWSLFPGPPSIQPTMIRKKSIVLPFRATPGWTVNTSMEEITLFYVQKIVSMNIPGEISKPIEFYGFFFASSKLTKKSLAIH